MELRMPVMDGYEATRRIKGLRPGLPVVAVTASAFEDQEATVWAVGVDAFLRKPFRWEEFFGVLERVLGIEFEAADASAADESTPAPTPPPAGVVQALREVARLLEADDTQAIDRFDAHREALAAADAARAAALEQQLSRFAFPLALATVRGWMGRGSDEADGGSERGG